MAGTLWYRQGPTGRPWPQANEPSNATPIGDAEHEPVGVFLANTAMDEIERAISSGAAAARVGLLVGRPCTGPARPFILVTDVILTDVPVDEDGVPRFSDSAFAEAEEQFAEAPEGSSIVGWFSAQPRKGSDIFAFERYVHRRFFPETWQLALLIDSKYRTSRLYRWEGGQLTPCDRFYFWNVVADPFDPHVASPSPTPTYQEFDDLTAAAHEASLPPPRAQVKATPWIRAAVGILIVYLMIPQAPGSIFWLRARGADQAQDLIELERNLAQLEMETRQLQALQTEAPANGRVPVTDGPKGSENAGSPPTSTSSTSATPSAESRPQASLSIPSLEGLDDVRDPAEGDYVIQPGDTMWSISRSLLGDPWEFRSLAVENQIPDPNRIFPGQRLRLPGEPAPDDESPSVTAVPGP